MASVPVDPRSLSNAIRSVAAAVGAGVVAGTIALGIGGRLAMTVLTLVNGARPEFSWGGSFEVVLVGAFYGAIGGTLLAGLRRFWPRGGIWRGIALGGLLLSLAWASSTVGRQTTASSPSGVLLIFSMSLAVFIVYGATAELLASAWAGNADRGRGGPNVVS